MRSADAILPQGRTRPRTQTQGSEPLRLEHGRLAARGDGARRDPAHAPVLPDRGGVAIAGASSVPLLPGDPTATAAALGGQRRDDAIFVPLHSHARSDRVSQAVDRVWLVHPGARGDDRDPVLRLFSPVAVVLVLGIYFTGLGKSTRLSFAVYATCAGMQPLVGDARDRRVLPTPARSPPTRLPSTIRSSSRRSSSSCCSRR